MSMAMFIRSVIDREGPISFARFMELALYQPELGYYSSGRCAIGRDGDYFTSVSVGPLFGRMMAAQFGEIWEKLGQPSEFTIVEQGAHHGEFAHDLLEELRASAPKLFAEVSYRIVEPFSVLRQRQRKTLEAFAEQTSWVSSIEELDPFYGVHFSNELLDAMPVHLLVCEGGLWRERFVTTSSEGFAFVEGPVGNERLHARLGKIPSLPNERYETEVNLMALDWIAALAPKLRQGIIIAADYGFTRAEFYAANRTTGTLQSRAAHRALPSPFTNPGKSDLTAHVEWSSLAEQAEEGGLTSIAFTDQHHFLTGLLARFPALAAGSAQESRALQTLLHPEHLGMKFQFLALTRNFSKGSSLAACTYAGEARRKLGLD
ncbi:MAG: SAM-dependent methyltransferase [Chthoniobacterales bacterium]|nr:SAM-dependent methyltransferase [Chthoniobacterales bacterium]